MVCPLLVNFDVFKDVRNQVGQVHEPLDDRIEKVWGLLLA